MTDASPTATAAPARKLVQPVTWVQIGIGLLIIAWYCWRYLQDRSLPGNQAATPAGWWGWFDQGATLRSTAALAALDLRPSEHHYPLGYAVLGLPFHWLMPRHPFFVVDLLSLLAAYWAFIRVTVRLGLPGMLGAVLFALAVLPDAGLLRQWIVPWNTTPVGAFLWVLLAACCAWLDGVRRPLVIGMLTGAVVVCRPSDALVTLPCLATLAVVELGRWQRGGAPGKALGKAPGKATAKALGKELVLLILGGALVALPFLAMHLSIYGLAQSSYMRSSADIGFTLHDILWKAYVIVVDPFPWFRDGEGLLQRAPWLALGLAGVVPALVRRARDRMLAGTLLVHGVLYVSYVDLLPMGLWRFLNVHYFTWALPGYALLAALLLRDLVRAGWPRRVAVASLAVSMLVLCVRVVPLPARADEPAKALDFEGPNPPFFDTFFSGRMAVRDSLGVLLDNSAIRAFIYPGGVRVIGLRRDFVGPVAWLPGRAPQAFEGREPVARWKIGYRLRWPPPWFRRAQPPAIPVPVE